MRILFALTAAYLPEFTGGIESNIHEASTKLRQRGHAVTVMARFRKRGFRSRRHLVRRLLRLEAGATCDHELGYPIFRSHRPLASIPWICEQFSPDVAIIQRGRLRELAGALLRQHIPTVTYLHNANFDTEDDVYPYNSGITYVACSRFIADAFEVRFGIPAEVIFPLVQPEWYRVETCREVVTFINPTPIKGVDTAFALAERRPDIPFEFVEAWPLDRKQLRTLRARAQALGNVTVLSRTDDMRSIYSRSRLVLMPTYNEEPFGRVVTEAQVSGIPAVATNCGGLPEAVGPGGILVDPAAPVSAWAEALGRLWDDPSAYAAACDAARAHAARPDIQVDAVMNRFIAILTRHATAGRSAKAGPGGGR